MSLLPSDNIEELGITLPEAAAPAGNYLPFKRIGDLVYVSGQLPLENGQLKYKGKVGADYSVEEGAEAARLCGINILSQLQAACLGNIDWVSACVKLNVFVNSTDDFTDQPAVANGVSDLMAEVFGDAGKAVRAAVSSNALPFGAAVEVEGVFQYQV